MCLEIQHNPHTPVLCWPEEQAGRCGIPFPVCGGLGMGTELEGRVGAGNG